MRAVTVVDWGDGGTTSAEVFRTKYNGDQTAFAAHAVERLRTWKFNAIGFYSNAYALPVATNMRPANPGPQLPFIRMLNVSWYGSIHEPGSLTAKWELAPSPFKTLLSGGVDPAVYVYESGAPAWPGHVPDPYDPNFATFAMNLAGDLRTAKRPTTFTGWVSATSRPTTTSGGFPHPTLSVSPWLIGTSPDDSDYVFGTGPGPRYPGLKGVVHPHIGWVVAVTKPTQSENTEVGKAFGRRQTVQYGDSVVYAKRAWRNWLSSKYGTVEALNAAWGSQYTTFDSDGGWPLGRGVLDESGRSAWMGNDWADLTKARPAVAADLNRFLEAFMEQYARVTTLAIRTATPRHLVFSPSMFNGHKGLSRFEVLRAAGRHFDVIDVNQNPDKPEYIPITYRETGGKPMVSWVGYTANADSALYTTDRADGLPTQADRARRYAQTLQLLANTRATDGTVPFVGLAWWEYMDKVGEKANWGLVTPRHNAYDGIEAVFKPGLDAARRPIGGEDRDYGDFLTGVQQAHDALATLIERSLP